MRCVVATAPGGPEVLQVVDRPTPEPGPSEVLVDVGAAGVNFIDTYRRAGVYPTPFPHLVGTEGAGTVSATGAAAGPWTPGDRVGWVAPVGSYAEQVVVPADQLVPVPDEVADADAAAVLLQGMTAHYLVTDTYPIGPGSTVLLHAGAGGVGLLATQLAAARGATVITTVSTAAKAELSRAAGASHVLRYDELDDVTADLPRAVRAVVPGGVDVVLDGVGRATFDASLASLRRRGGLVLFGGASGQVPPLDPQRLAAAGSVHLTRPTLADFTATTEELRWRAAEVLGAVARGTLTLRVEGRPLAEAARAHADLEARRTTGALVLEP